MVHKALFIEIPSVLSYLSGIRSAQLDRGITWPDTSSWHKFRRVLRFLKKKYGCELTATPRRPITVAVLVAIKRTLDLALPDDRMFFAASCMAVFCFWRGSEFLHEKKHDTDQQLLFRRMSWAGSGRNTACIVQLLRTKTKWWRRDVTTSAVRTGGEACPVQAMSDYIARSTRAFTASSFLFALENGDPLSRQWMMARTTRALRAAGILDDRYRSFSWRGGGALSARRAGLSDSVIKLLGRWTSNAFMFYLPVEHAELSSAQVMFAKANFPRPRGRLDPVLGFCSSSLYSDGD